jgi:succinoglycan biosynthesis protein ExoA
MNECEFTVVSVIVPCRNEIRFIERFLDSLLRQELPGFDVEFLIADGMSSDGTREILERYEREYSFIRIIDNLGKIVSTGLNRAVREARGEIIVRMDVHSDYAPDYIFRCLEVLQETNADNVGGPVLTRANGYLAHAIALAYHDRFARGGAKSRDVGFEGFVESVTYGCWRKSTLERIGLFDESLCRSQDFDLNRRLIGSGGKIWQSPKITSWYWPRTSLPALFQQYLQYGYWKASVILKHCRSASWRHVVPGVCFLVGVILLFGAVLASVCDSAWCGRLSAACGASAGLYLAVSFCAAFLIAKRDGWRFFWILPVVFATYHFSYALGFLLGFTYRPGADELPPALRKVLTVITR